MARIDDMIDEPEHPYLGAEFGRRYVDPSTATNAQQAGEYIASNEAFRRRQDEREQAVRREMALRDGQFERRPSRMTADEKIERMRAFDMLGSLLGEINGLYDCVGYDAPKLVKWKHRAARVLASIYGEASNEVEWLLGNAFPATGAAYKWEGGMLGETLGMLQREFTKMRDSFAEKEGVHLEGRDVLVRHESVNEYDVFVSHANANKQSFVDSLYEQLNRLRIRVWYDSAEIDWGDGLKEKIQEGLAKCRFGIVILSPEFIDRKWTNQELTELLTRQNGSHEKVVLPLLYNLTVDEMKARYPVLENIKAREVRSDEDAKDVVIDFARILIRSLKSV